MDTDISGIPYLCSLCNLWSNASRCAIHYEIMPLLGIFNLVLLVVDLFILALAVLCLVFLIAGCFLRNKVMIIASLGVPALLFGLVFVISEVNEAQNPFPELEPVAVRGLLPGTYVLDPSAFQYLKARGFNDFSAEIVLNPDGTFNVARMPHIWMDGTQDGSGYDHCSGKWSVGEESNRSGDGKLYYTSNVTLKGMSNVTSQAGETVSRPGSAVFLGIAGPKGKRKDYALSVPIFTGDFYYIWFVRRSR